MQHSSQTQGQPCQGSWLGQQKAHQSWTGFACAGRAPSCAVLQCGAAQLQQGAAAADVPYLAWLSMRRGGREMCSCWASALLKSWLLCPVSTLSLKRTLSAGGSASQCMACHCPVPPAHEAPCQLQPPERLGGAWCRGSLLTEAASLVVLKAAPGRLPALRSSAWPATAQQCVLQYSWLNV